MTFSPVAAAASSPPRVVPAREHPDQARDALFASLIASLLGSAASPSDHDPTAPPDSGPGAVEATSGGGPATVNATAALAAPSPGDGGEQPGADGPDPGVAPAAMDAAAVVAPGGPTGLPGPSAVVTPTGPAPASIDTATAGVAVAIPTIADDWPVHGVDGDPSTAEHDHEMTAADPAPFGRVGPLLTDAPAGITVPPSSAGTPPPSASVTPAAVSRPDAVAPPAIVSTIATPGPTGAVAVPFTARATVTPPLGAVDGADVAAGAAGPARPPTGPRLSNDAPPEARPADRGAGETIALATASKHASPRVVPMMSSSVSTATTSVAPAALPSAVSPTPPAPAPATTTAPDGSAGGISGAAVGVGVGGPLTSDTPVGSPAAPALAAALAHEQVAVAATQLLKSADGSSRVVLRLHPEELGSVEVEVRVLHGTVDLRVHAATAEAHAALAEHLPDLRREIEQAGLRAGDLTLSTNPGQADRDGRRFPGGVGPAPLDSMPVDETDVAAPAPVAPVFSTNDATSVDVRV